MMAWWQYLSWGATGWGDELASGLLITLSLALATLPLGLLLGLLTTAMLLRGGIWRGLGLGYTTLIRGTPELLTLFVVYNGAALLLNRLFHHHGDAEFIGLSPFLAGVISLALVLGAFAAEVLRGAYQALEKGPREAGLALGLRRWQVFLLVEFRPMLQLALPGLGNLWLNLVKDTALVSVIALNDLMRQTSIAVGATRKPFFFFLLVCLIYWLICLSSEWGIARLEKACRWGRPATHGDGKGGLQ